MTTVPNPPYDTQRARTVTADLCAPLVNPALDGATAAHLYFAALARTMDRCLGPTRAPTDPTIADVVGHLVLTVVSLADSVARASGSSAADVLAQNFQVRQAIAELSPLEQAQLAAMIAKG